MLTISSKYYMCLNTACKCIILARHLKHTLTYTVLSTIQRIYNFKQTNRKAHLHIKFQEHEWMYVNCWNCLKNKVNKIDHFLWSVMHSSLSISCELWDRPAGPFMLQTGTDLCTAWLRLDACCCIYLYSLDQTWICHCHRSKHVIYLPYDTFRWHDDVQYQT